MILEGKPHLFKQPGSIYIQFAPSLHYTHSSILAEELIHDITAHKHGDEMTCGETTLIGLRKRSNITLFTEKIVLILHKIVFGRMWRATHTNY